MLSLILSLNSHAQNVGIGTNTPVSRLDIAGANAWDLVNTEGDMRIGNATYRLKVGVALGGGGAGAVGIMQAGGVGIMNIGAGGTYLLALNGSNSTSSFTGNVGIGTSPATRLDVAGTSADDLINSEGDFRVGNASYRLKIGVGLFGITHGTVNIMQSGGTGILNLGAAGNYLIQLNGQGLATRFTGNVGIGTSPATRLDVAGTNAWDLVNGEGDVRIGTPAYRLKIGVALDGGGVGAVGMMQAGGIGQLSLGAGSKFLMNLNGPSGFVDFANNTGGLRINGNAGIGGQVLTSNGTAAPEWKSGPSFTSLNSVSVSSGNFQTVNVNQTWVIPGLTYTFSTSVPVKAFVSYNGYLKSIACALCPAELVFGRIKVDGVKALQTSYDLPNGSTTNMSASTLVNLAPGTHTINVEVTPFFNSISVGGVSNGAESSMQILLFPTN